MFRTSFIVFEVAFRTCDCRRVCLILSASCSSSTVAEAVKLLEDRGQVFEDLEEELEQLEGQKDIVEVAVSVLEGNDLETHKLVIYQASC